MRISGFSFVRDAVRLNYPIRQVIDSLLPLVDEFVVAVGPSQDGTLEEIRSIGDSRSICARGPGTTRLCASRWP